MVGEAVSGSEAIARRRGFSRLIDRLGRDAIDVSAIVGRLADMDVRVHCLALGGVDLTSSAGRMTMGVINAVAQFERDLLVERTRSGLARARTQGKRLAARPRWIRRRARPCSPGSGGARACRRSRASTGPAARRSCACAVRLRDAGPARAVEETDAT